MRRKYIARQVISSVETLTFPMEEVKKELYKSAHGCYPTTEELENIKLEVLEANTFPPYFGRRLTLTITEVLDGSQGS